MVRIFWTRVYIENADAYGAMQAINNNDRILAF